MDVMGVGEAGSQDQESTHGNEDLITIITIGNEEGKRLGYVHRKERLDFRDIM